MQPYVAYYRVSTQMQGKSGLGLEAQKQAVAHYNPIAEYVDIESGKNNDRAQLQAAKAYARANKSILIVAKLDRLSRNAHHILGLMEEGVRLRCADMPDADEFQLHLYAILAQKERKMISERTSAAIRAKQERGEQWAKNTVKIERADEFAQIIQRHIVALQQQGIVTPAAIARGLNEANVRTSKGSTWGVGQVIRVMARKNAE